MKNNKLRLLALCTALCLLMLLWLPTAAAAGATSVWVNNVELTAAAPYWQNGSGAASATEPVGGWNAYFNAATATLTLQDAVLTAYSLLPPAWATNAYGFIVPDGELSIVLQGSNTITFTGSDPPSGSEPQTLSGFYSHYDTAIYGPGSLEIVYTTYASTIFIAFYTSETLRVFSGTLTVTAEANILEGILAEQGFWLAGGDVIVQGTGGYLILVGAPDGEFRISGGNLYAIGEGSAYVNARGLIADTIRFSGGTGFVKVTSPTIDAYGLIYKNGNLNITGGYFEFMGSTAAINNSGYEYAITSPPVDMLVNVAEDIDGVNKQRWTSRAIGELATNSVRQLVSPFRYAEFIFNPQTGDGQTPLLWAGAGLCVLLGVLGVGICLRGKLRQSRER